MEPNPIPAEGVSKQTMPNNCGLCSRREFFSKMAVAAVALSMAGELLSSCMNNLPDPPGPGTKTLDLTNPNYSALNIVGGAAFLPWNNSVPMIVICTGTDSYVALSSYCTHAGCQLDLPAKGSILCECHGSVFDESGQVLKGPARRPLPQATVSVSGNILTVTMA